MTICVGVITGAHGIRGALKVKTFTSDPLAIGTYGPLLIDGQPFAVSSLAPHQKSVVILTLKNLKDRNQAETLRGKEIHVDSLPPLEDPEDFYHKDLLGLEVKDQDTLLGHVKGIHHFGGGDVLEIASDAGHFYLPFTKEAVPEVNISQGFISINPALLEEFA